MPRRRQPELLIHRGVLAHLRARAVRNALYWHTPNGMLRSKTTGAILKSLGTLAGVSDLLILHNGQLFALELKAPGGRSTPAQMAFREAVNRAGGFASEAVGLDAALRWLQAWGLLRGETQ
jgi:hypothetical protein